MDAGRYNSCENKIRIWSYWICFQLDCLKSFVELHFRDANFANSALFDLQDGQFKKAFQLCKCDLEDRKKNF